MPDNPPGQKRFPVSFSAIWRIIFGGNWRILARHPSDPIAAIDAAANRQGRLVEEFLFLARADAGGLARDKGPVCLLEVLEEAAAAVEGPRQPCVRLEVLDPGLMVTGSGSELTRLFTNLLQNAVRHTPPEGTVTVSARVDAMSADARKENDRWMT